MFSSSLKIGKNDLHTSARAREHHALNIAREQVLREPYSFEQTALSQSQHGIGNRGVVDNKVTLTARGTVVVHQFNRLLDQIFGKFFGVANGRRRQDELRVCPVKF